MINFSNKKIFLDTIIYTLLPKISFFASIVILPWISPYLTLMDYGCYGLIMSYVAVLQVVITLGQNIVLQNSFFTHGKNFYLIWRRCFLLMIIMGVLCSLFFGIITNTLLEGQLGENRHAVFFLVSMYLILSPIETLAVNYYVLNEKSLAYSLGAALSGMISVVTSFFAIKYFRLGYIGWIAALSIGMLVNFLYYFRRLIIKEKIIPPYLVKRTFLKRALVVGVPLTPHQLSLYILGVSDRLLLEYFKVGIAKIGFYSQGYNMGSQGGIIVNGVFQALSRQIQEGFRSDEYFQRLKIRKMLILIPMALSLTFFLGSLWMKEIFLILFKNPELNKAYPIAIIVLSSYMYFSLYTFFSYPLSIKNRTFSISKISLTAAIVNIVGNIILIPYYGIWAALGVTYFSYIIFGLGGLLDKENRIFLQKYINISALSFMLCLVNVVLFVTVYLSKDLDIRFKVFESLIVGGIFVFLFKKKKF